MPIRVCTYEDLTPHRRGRKSLIESLPEFTEVQIKLSTGLKPYEAVEIELPKTEAKNLREAFKYRVLALLKKLNIEDYYEVHSYRANGKDFVSVANTAEQMQMAAA